MIKPFESARAKLRRANVHIKTLTAAAASMDHWAEGIIDVEILTPDQAPRGDFTEAKGRAIRKVPDDICATLGDAAHNLRTALDTAACDLVRLNGGNPNGVYFPFCINKEAIPKAIFEKNMTRARSDVIDILMTLGVYVSPTLCLRTVHDLDVLDEHVSMMDCLSVSPWHRFSIEKWIVRLDFEIVFQQLGKHLVHLNGRPVIPVIEDLAGQATYTIEMLASLYGL